ncbi:MAG: hypothetical protein AAGG01_12370 [Planctomycetota bacterium]
MTQESEPDQPSAFEIFTGFNGAIDAVAVPEYESWDEPGSAVVTWAAIHVSACLAVVAGIVAQTDAGLAAQMMSMSWVLLSSGLPVLVLARAFGISLETVHPATVTKFFNRRSGLKQGVWSVYAMGAMTTMDLPYLAIFAMALTVSVGARVAGLDAWRTQMRPPGFYVRLLLSPGGLTMATLLVLVTLGYFWLIETVLDPSIEPLMGGVELPRDDQNLVIVGSIILLTLPSLLVAELIGGISRYERQILDRLESAERQRVRRALDRGLHDRALGKLSAIIMSRPGSPRREEMLDELQAELRDLQIGLRRESQGLTTAELVRHLQRFYDHSAADVTITLALEAAAIRLNPEQTDVVESAVHNLAGNSLKHGQPPWTWTAITYEEGHLRITHTDPGEGFDLELALVAGGGGLATLLRDLDALGGWLETDGPSNPPVTTVVIPLDH